MGGRLGNLHERAVSGGLVGLGCTTRMLSLSVVGSTLSCATLGFGFLLYSVMSTRMIRLVSVALTARGMGWIVTV